MRRILITGASGSGTTTLGQAMAGKLGWHFIDTDDYFWLPTKPPYQIKRASDARLQLILDELRRHEPVFVSGSIMNWGAELEDSFEVIVFLYLETSIRVERLKIREEEELGYVDPEFIKWASDYDTGPAYGRSLAKHKAWLAERKCRILNLEGNLTLQKKCELLMDALPAGVMEGMPSG